MHWFIHSELPVQPGDSAGGERRSESQGKEGGGAGNCCPGLSHGTIAGRELHRTQRQLREQRVLFNTQKITFHSNTGRHVPYRTEGKAQPEKQVCKHNSGSRKITLLET